MSNGEIARGDFAVVNPGLIGGPSVPPAGAEAPAVAISEVH
jgi:hypothetical protein